MVSIVTLAAFLLALRIISVIIISRVIRRQWQLLRLHIHPALRRFRLVLIFLSLAILLGNMIPIVIDAATLFVPTGRPAQIRPLSVGYAMSNAITSVISSYLIWTLYRLAAEQRDIDEIAPSK